jgi:hypothetical protein
MNLGIGSFALGRRYQDGIFEKQIETNIHDTSIAVARNFGEITEHRHLSSVEYGLRRVELFDGQLGVIK